jgi:ubiquinone/menaquinone biosynthesis C-methylase UbiE
VQHHLSEIAESFDARAATYGASDWHQRCADRLIEVAGIRPGDRVMDAGTGTGFAALAAARIAGPLGHVQGVDISPGMLREARAALRDSGLTNVAFVQADAVHPPDRDAGTFDAVVCAAGLLYMPVDDALRAWHRVLKPGGRVAFSTMRGGSPPAAQIFRDCALAFGLSLQDPSAPLGSEAACTAVLEAAGFEVVTIVSETIDFTPQDLSLAWESNFRSAGHAEVRRLGPEALRALEQAYRDALAREIARDAAVFSRAHLLYAVGVRPDGGDR